MRAFAEIALSLLSVLGLMALGWVLFGQLLRPVGGKHTVSVIPGTGDGAELEQAVRGLIWLREGGLLRENRIVIADCGLNAAGKAVAAALTLRETGVELCSVDRLPQYISERTEGGH